jgi:pimeloyl-ACP methyl ester carboxylesterase
VLLTTGAAFAAPPRHVPLLSMRGSQTHPCNTSLGPRCSVVEVPVDRSGRVGGTIRLHVEILPPAGVSRGAIFLVAGGPGQASARAFTLNSSGAVATYRYLFPGYTLVAYDDRGTGASGFLDCPSFHTADSSSDPDQVTAACAQELGPQRDFYSTADHAEDLEAVRQSLGFDRVAILGVSYGTKLALAYARAHPDHVERLLLDSVVGPSRDDAFATDVLQAMPATLAEYCAAGACAAATPSFSDDVAGVANQLADAPIRGRVLELNGRTSEVELDAAGFLDLVVGADLDPGLAAELPAAVHAARTGDPKPLLRLYALPTSGGPTSRLDWSTALYFATVCADRPFPWLPDTPLAERAQLVDHALAALPAGSFGPFGSSAASLGNAGLCLGWPGAASSTAPATGPLPDVPVLALSGGLDLRTPTAGAAAAVAEFPQGHLLVVPSVGHSVLTADPSPCAARAVRAWILRDTAPTTCARSKPYLQPLAAFPARPSTQLAAAQTLGVAARTMDEAEAVWLMTAGSSKKVTIPGIYGGKLSSKGGGLVLQGYSIAPGVSLTGFIALAKVGPPLRFAGFVFVEGPAAAHGTLRLSPTRLQGTLGNKKVSSAVAR